MPYGDFKELPKRKACNKASHGRAFNIPENPRYDGYQCGLASTGFLIKRLLH